MNTPNIRYYAKMVNTTQKGKKTPKYTITAQAGYYPPMEQLRGRDGQISMNLMEKLKDGDNVPSMRLQAKNSLNFTGLKEYFQDGKLSGYAYGYPLDRHTTAQAVEKIGDTLHIDIGQAVVTGLEFGTNFMMRHQVSDYLAKLGNMPRLGRYHFEPSTLYYKGTGKQQPKVFAFYDKMADATAKGAPYPENMKGANLLKYEMRLNGRLSQQLGVPEVTASTLTETPFYRMMVKRYQNSYFSISKQNQVKTNVMSDIKTVSDAFNVFVARLISQTDQTQIGGFLDELKDAAVFEDRKNYSRLKKKIQEVATKANITVSDELIKELDNEVRNVGAYV